MSRSSPLLLVSLIACSPDRHPVSVGTPPSGGAESGTLVAVRRSHPLVLDGVLDEPEWRAAPSTGRFVDAATGVFAPPHTEARAVFDDDALYIGFFAADQNQRVDDRVSVQLAYKDAPTLVLEVDPRGHLHAHALGGAEAAAPPGVIAAADTDGTVDDDSDDDEEWTVELAIPWRVLGVARPSAVKLNLCRHDQPRGYPVRDEAWKPRHAPLGVVAPM